MAATARYANGHVYDNPRDIGDGHRSENSFASVSAADFESFDHYTQGSRQSEAPKKSLTTRECVELFQETVENARQTYAKPLSHDKTPEQLKPTLTLEMSRKGIQQIPAEVVQIIRQDVERLQLSHNHLRSISNEFGTCSALKYLNLRGNRFTVIPPALFALHQLEILDVSKNELTEISPEIGNLKVLRVLSIRHNRLKDLPLCIGSLKSMRMLRLDENPWGPELAEVIQEGEASYRANSPGRFDESECDRHLTPYVTDFLKRKQNEIESPLETPRALSRFPVNPNDSGYTTTGSESGNGSRSPGLLRSRTHSRTASSQVAQPRRPSLTPLALQDKMRSNSESHLQATQIKSKRMGIIPKKKPELEVLDESRASRNSFHLRGQSHSSALRNVTRAGDQSPADEHRLSGQKGTFVRRLSSVPEQKQVKMVDDLVESAKGILYSLHSMQSHLASIVPLIQDSRSRASSLERFQHQASVQLEFLDQSLQDLELSVVKGRSKRVQHMARKTVCRATHTSMSLFTQIGGILAQNAHRVVVHGDRRYVRGLMVALWGSITEQRNARRKLVPQDTLGTLPSAMKTAHRLVRDDALTPTQDHVKNGRTRAGSLTQSFQNQTNIAAVVNSRPPTSHSTMSSQANSRSSSRTGMYHPPSSAASFVNTPRSGESFGINMFPPRSRAGSLSVEQHRVRKLQEESDQFERIYKTLLKAVEKGITAINQLEPRFMRSYEENQQSYVPMEVKNLWQEIVGRTRSCGEASKVLKQRLSNMKVNDPATRNSTSLWRLTKEFTGSYVTLLMLLKPNRALVADASTILHPTHKLISETVALIRDSPWEKLQEDSLPPSQVHSRAPTPVQNYPPPIHTQMVPPPIPHPSMATHQHYQHRRPNGSNGSANGSAISPQSGIPATPMSAALGPAAQSTVPKTPASGTSGGSMSSMFEGNVFQRADNLLSQQTMYRRPSAAP